MSLLAVAALALVGCTGHNGQSTPGSTVGSSPRDVSAGGTWVPPSGTKAVTQPVRFALGAADGRRITVAAIGGGCTEDAHLTGTETPETVTLHLFGYESKGKDVACPANLIVWARSTLLRAPLGARQLDDGSTGKRVAYFDGRKLATVNWLPAGASRPADRPNGRGWARLYAFKDPRHAPIEIDQVYGNQLTAAQFQPNSMVAVRREMVHGHPARLVTQTGANSRLLQARLGWVEHGFTFTVSSSPEHTPQQPFGVSVLMRVANDLALPGG
jgi:hypothetical protein